MLVLSRKVHEAIIIGDGIEVVVTEIRNGRVKLGVSVISLLYADSPRIRSVERKRKSQEKRFVSMSGGFIIDKNQLYSLSWNRPTNFLAYDPGPSSISRFHKSEQGGPGFFI